MLGKQHSSVNFFHAGVTARIQRFKNSKMSVYSLVPSLLPLDTSLVSTDEIILQEARLEPTAFLKATDKRFLSSTDKSGETRETFCFNF